MADNTQIVDHILKQEGQGTYSVYFKDLTDTDKQSIQAWLKDNLQYNDVQGAPELPSDNKAYDENNNIKPFDKLAFTADYDDLNNAPTIPDIGGERPTAFNPIAFTGVVNLDNVAVSNVINLSEYSINSNDAEHIAGMTANDISNNNTKLQNIGSSDNFVKGLNAFQRNGNGILLFNTLQSKIISGGFLITKTPTYLVSNSGIYFLTDVKNTTWDGPTLQYFELHLVAVTNSNYATIRTYETNITDEAAEDILENIELTAKNVILIFDFSNNILYCKTKEIGREQEQGILEETDPVFAASPAANITNQNITNWNNKATINDINNLKGNPTGNNDTLEKLEQHKAQIIYINVGDEPYNYSNFGVTSFYNNNDTLIDNIFELLDNNQIIILNSSTGNWFITNYLKEDNIGIKAISLYAIPKDNYYQALLSLSEEITKQEEETDEEFNIRFNNTLLSYTTTVPTEGLLIKDSNQNCSYFKFVTYNTQGNIAMLAQRIINLEQIVNNLQEANNN